MGSERVCASVDAIASYVDGRLSGGGLDAVEAHLDACSACARVVIAAAGDHRSGGPARIRPRIFHPGQVLAGRYEIIAFLGAGGMGEVYEAQDRELGDRIALKTVGAAISLDSAAVNRFKAEAQLARKVTHRNVCRIFDLGIHVEGAGDGGAPCLAPFLTMELIRGQSLSEHVRSGRRFGADEATEIACQLARGLEAAHEARVLHRDLKSDNVLLLPSSKESFRAIITDFGLAAAATIGDGSEAAASSGVPIYGTRPYLAPERLAGAPATAASDIYALGVVMYELVTGSLTAASPIPTTFGDLVPSTPLASVILACLSPDPTGRPPSSTEVVRLIENASAPASAAAAAPTDDNRSRGRRRRKIWWVLGSAIGCTFAASLLLLTDVARSRTKEQSIATPPVVTREAVPAETRPSGVSPAEPEPAPAGLRERRPRGKSGVRPGAGAAQKMLASAEQQLRGGRLEEACLTGREAAARQSGLAAAWEFLGRCYMRLGDSEKALGYYRRYLTLAPDGPNAAFIRAIVDEDQP